MSTLRVNTIQNSAGTGTPTINGLAQAWVNFNGTGTVAIRASYNVSSITDNGTGDYTVNFTNAMTDADYAWSASTDQIAYHASGTHVQSTTQFRFVRLAHDAAVTDVALASLTIFR